ncbi:MAG TPA: bifunctional diguanylate cyclase/phosphodiesterase [Actinomycetales bacterium]|nr:bifunctional diguanylate cyclase/phosphodiesterase [Actinomycetales bacterium]
MTFAGRLRRHALLGWLLLAGVTAYAVTLSTTASYAVRTVTALLAAAALLWRARRGDAIPRIRRIFAAGILAGATSGVAATVIALTTSAPVETGSWSQWLELAYVPFTVTALLIIPGRKGGRLRAVANGSIAAASLWYLALALVIEPRGISRLTDGERIGIGGFIVIPIFVLAVLVTVLPRVSANLRTFTVSVGVGLGIFVAADVLFFVWAWNDTYSPTSWIAALYQVGLVVMLCGSMTRTPAVAATREQQQIWMPSFIGEVVLPFTPVLLAVLVGAISYLSHRPYTRAQMVPILLIGLTILARHVISVRENATLVRDLETRERAAVAEARRDALTGLGNRTAFVDEVARLLADPANHPIAVAVLDLNDFKDVNDTHGHSTGDWLLRECGRALTVALPRAVIARLGGDEFAVCQPEASDGGHALAEAVTEAFAVPLTLDRRNFTVRPSIGVVLDERSPGRAKGPDAHHLLAHADVAMYQAKASKDNVQVPYVILTGAERARAASLIQLRDEISHPDLRQFHVVYQPIIELSSGRIRGVEALLRWNHPELGNIRPDHFIPLSEQVGTVTVLGEHVLKTALRDLSAWKRVAPDVRLAMGVNLSPRQLIDDDLPMTVADLLDAHGLERDLLVLEITEGALMQDLELAARMVAAFRDSGVSVAIDDYGTGYSSLRYLRRFAADVVKIDREFVQSMATDVRTTALMESVMQMAAALDLQTIAEGIETIEHLRAAQALGCELGQGFLFSPGVPAEQITELARAHHVYGVAEVPPLPEPRVPTREGTKGTVDRSTTAPAGPMS